MLTGNRSMTREIKKDVAKGLENDEAILESQAAIKNDTSEILQEIARLRAQLPDDGATLLPSKKNSNSTLAHYLDDLTSYAETVCWSGEDSDTDPETEELERVSETMTTQSGNFVPPPVNASSNFSRPMGKQYSIQNPYTVPVPRKSLSAAHNELPTASRPVLSSAYSSPLDHGHLAPVFKRGADKYKQAHSRPVAAPPVPLPAHQAKRPSRDTRQTKLGEQSTKERRARTLEAELVAQDNVKAEEWLRRYQRENSDGKYRQELRARILEAELEAQEKAEVVDKARRAREAIDRQQQIASQSVQASDASNKEQLERHHVSSSVPPSRSVAKNSHDYSLYEDGVSTGSDEEHGILRVGNVERTATITYGSGYLPSPSAARRTQDPQSGYDVPATNHVDMVLEISNGECGERSSPLENLERMTTPAHEKFHDRKLSQGQGDSFLSSLVNTPKRKHKSTSSSIFGIPKISRWSEPGYYGNEPSGAEDDGRLHSDTAPTATRAGETVLPGSDGSYFSPRESSLKAAKHERSRSLDRERIKQRVMQRLQQQEGENATSSESKESVNKEGLMPARRSHRRRSKDVEQASANSGTKSSPPAPDSNRTIARPDESSPTIGINNSKLLATVEDAIRRLLLPELDGLKEGNRLPKEENRSSQEQNTTQDNAASYSLGTDKSSREYTTRLHRHKPRVVLNQHGEDPGVVLSSDYTRREAPEGKRQAKRSPTSVADAARAALAGAGLTAAALKAHTSREEKKGMESERKGGEDVSEVVRHFRVPEVIPRAAGQVQRTR